MDKDIPKQKVCIGANLDAETQRKLLKFLKERKDYFDWDISDMPGIDPDVIIHKLNVNP